jgi:hypothetical protein
MNMVRTEEFGSNQPPHPLGDRPSDLPLSAAVWDKADHGMLKSEFVIIALYEAVKELECEVRSLR